MAYKFKRFLFWHYFCISKRIPNESPGTWKFKWKLAKKSDIHKFIEEFIELKYNNEKFERFKNKNPELFI